MPFAEDDADWFAYMTAARLEMLLDPEHPDGLLGFLEGVQEFSADLEGRLGLVMSCGDPYAELVLGAGPPHVEVWCRGSFGAAPATLDPATLEEALYVLLHTTMDAALGR